MSYTAKVKRELFRLPDLTAAQKTAELAGILSCKNALFPDRVLLQVESLDVAKRVWVLVRELTKLKMGIKYSVSKKLGAHRVFTVQIVRQRGFAEFTRQLTAARDGARTGEGERDAFIRGIFLACGYVKDPRREYALDFFMDNERLAWELFTLFERVGKKASLTKKRSKFLLYLRNAEDIKDLLILMGALGEYFNFENVTILKDLKNKTVRQMNYELANETKTLATGQRQMRMITAIRDKIGFDAMSDVLTEACLARLENPEASLQEIADSLGISKSGLRNRLRRVEEIYKTINTAGENTDGNHS